MIKPPLILTLALDKKDAEYFTSLRQKYFPSDRNFIDAHLTLFHALPNELTLIDSVKEFCNTCSSFRLKVISPVSIGRGVALKLESKELISLHHAMQQKWNESLSLQDKHKIWPHITIQNKVTATEAAKTLSELKIDFVPFEIAALGLQVWEYLNGPWKFIEQFSFR